MNRQYKLKQDKEDNRDHMRFNMVEGVKVKLPKTVDIRDKCPEVFNQGNLGSCTANAGCSYRAMLLPEGPNSKVFSRLFLYFKERLIEGTVAEDAGASMRDICVALNKYGVCEENHMPYIEDNFAKAPSMFDEVNAKQYAITQYKKLTSITEIKTFLATTQRPVLMGMKVFSSFESDEVAKTGVVPMPKADEEDMGGHAVLIVGYIDGSLPRKVLAKVKKILGIKSAAPKGYFVVRNSWGEEWGDKGYFYLPYEFVTSKLAFDFWTMG